MRSGRPVSEHVVVGEADGAAVGDVVGHIVTVAAGIGNTKLIGAFGTVEPTGPPGSSSQKPPWFKYLEGDHVVTERGGGDATISTLKLK